MNAISECIQCDPPPQLSMMESRSRRWNAFWIVGCSRALDYLYTGKGMASKRMSGDLQRISKALRCLVSKFHQRNPELPTDVHIDFTNFHSTLSSISLTPPTPSLLVVHRLIHIGMLAMKVVKSISKYFYSNLNTIPIHCLILLCWHYSQSTGVVQWVSVCCDCLWLYSSQECDSVTSALFQRWD